jgi:AraC-like DNA-binding protein
MSVGAKMIGGEISSFDDPEQYQAAIRSAEIEIYPTAAGDFRAELTKIDFERLWMQRGCESLPRIRIGKVNSNRVSIYFLANRNEAPFRHCGVEVSPGEIVVDSSDSVHRKTRAPCHWGVLSLAREDFATLGSELAGHDLSVPRATSVVKSAPALVSRLLRLHEQAAQLARTAPSTLAMPEVSRALEQALILAMIRCLTDGTSEEMSVSAGRQSKVIVRLEEFLAANQDHSVYLAEICAAVGVSERALRRCCEEHLGIGPIKYLWLRRMHLAHRALKRADAIETTVTHIATQFGFYELGRFSVEYRTLFGEPPSITLHRPPDDRLAFQDRPFALPAFQVS